jgi:hypothetical protein
VLESRIAGRYADTAGQCITKLAFSIPKAARDGTAGVTPWYLQAWVKPFWTTNSVQDTYMNDNPGSTFTSSFSDPMIRMGQRFLLDQTEGDRFGAWQVVRNRMTGEIPFLKWVTWEIDWEHEDSKTARARSHEVHADHEASETS